MASDGGGRSIVNCKQHLFAFSSYPNRPQTNAQNQHTDESVLLGHRVLQLSGNSKVSQLAVSVRCEQDVAALHVTVDDARLAFAPNGSVFGAGGSHRQLLGVQVVQAVQDASTHHLCDRQIDKVLVVNMPPP